MIYANPAFLSAIGRQWADVKGRTDREWRTDLDQAHRVVQSDDDCMAAGGPLVVEEEIVGRRGPRTYLTTKAPLIDADGATAGLFAIGMDITERKHAETHQRFLADEMRHRVKNTLAVVQAMARQTLKMSGMDRGIWDAFEGRLVAMAKAHDLLTAEQWVGADVVSIVAEALKVHTGAERASFDIDGPAALLDAQTALSLSMVLHELGTNALKHGALSVPGGRIAIRWQVEDDARGKVFDLRWNEHGGPTLDNPAHRGFGSRLVEQAFSQHDVDHARLEFLPQGVQFRLRIVLPADPA